MKKVLFIISILLSLLSCEKKLYLTSFEEDDKEVLNVKLGDSTRDVENKLKEQGYNYKLKGGWGEVQWYNLEIEEPVEFFEIIFDRVEYHHELHRLGDPPTNKIDRITLEKDFDSKNDAKKAYKKILKKLNKKYSKLITHETENQIIYQTLYKDGNTCISVIYGPLAADLNVFLYVNKEGV